jgi:hypothetical protein
LLMTGTLAIAALPARDLAIRSPTIQRSDTIVRVAGEPVHPGMATVVEEISIGGPNATAESSFVGIQELMIGRDGSAFLMDGGSGHTTFVRQYDPNGRPLHTFGRKGQGPGEFNVPSGLAQLADGKVILYAGALGRINVYSAAGDPVEQWIIGRDQGVTSLSVDPAGTIAGRIQVLRGSGRAATTRLERFAPAMERMNIGGTVLDTVTQPDLPPITVLEARTSGAFVTVFLVPYSPAPFAEWSRLGYYVMGTTSRYAINLYVPRAGAAPSALGGRQPGLAPAWKPGDPIISIRRSVATVPVSAVERSERRDVVVRQIGGRKVERLPEIPGVKPAFKYVRVGDDGRIWVNVSKPSERLGPRESRNSQAPASSQTAWREPNVFDVFEPNGVYLGEVAFPDNVQLYSNAMRGDVVWAVARDDDGVPVVKRYRVVWRG